MSDPGPSGTSILSPLTGGSEVGWVRSYSSRELAERWMAETSIDVSVELARTDEIHLYRCRRSQLEFFRPAEAAGSARLYERLAEHSWYYAPDRWEHETALQWMGAEGGRLLEIGCGRGGFLESARRHGWDPMGLELNQTAACEASSRGLRVEVSPVESVSLQGKDRFDSICGFQVLEHLPHPRSFLEAAVALLKPGGWLILGVPNGAGWIARQFDVLDLPPHHMARWNGAALQYLTRILPLEMEHLAVEPLPADQVLSFVRASLMPWPARDRASGWRRRWLRRLTRWSARAVRSAGLNASLPGRCLLAGFRRR